MVRPASLERESITLSSSSLQNGQRIFGHPYQWYKSLEIYHIDCQLTNYFPYIVDNKTAAELNRPRLRTLDELVLQKDANGCRNHDGYRQKPVLLMH